MYSLNGVQTKIILFYLGEMLPPAFTYFLDVSEFLRRYGHIAVKLGEDEKHIVQSFIDGKLPLFV